MQIQHVNADLDSTVLIATLQVKCFKLPHILIWFLISSILQSWTHTLNFRCSCIYSSNDNNFRKVSFNGQHIITNWLPVNGHLINTKRLPVNGKYIYTRQLPVNGKHIYRKQLPNIIINQRQLTLSNMTELMKLPLRSFSYYFRISFVCCQFFILIHLCLLDFNLLYLLWMVKMNKSNVVIWFIKNTNW